MKLGRSNLTRPLLLYQAGKILVGNGDACKGGITIAKFPQKETKRDTPA